MKFTYVSGQRPLEGYALKRGIGKGGFGEVYFGVSDGGKEVALKLLRGNSDVELRGVAQCLNLKHPNLVDLYDLRHDNQGDAWVIMEYVAGEPLNVVLNRHPGGVPIELAVQWFTALARAVIYLHDHGIVHRDLKPGNIFLENGTVKVGDYGLCKFISGTQGGRHSQSVGTVHYMAPEISNGNYNKQVDVYAAGVILYEMLTGKVPFDGESAGEILMKHLTAPPDLSKVPAPFAGVLAKALAKNPAARYNTMAEFLRAVENLTAEPRRAAPPKAAAKLPPAQVLPAEPLLNVLPVYSFRQQVTELCGSLAVVPLLAGLATMLWATPVGLEKWTQVSGFFFQIVLACWAVMLPAKFWTTSANDSWTRRLVMLAMGTLVGLGVLWLDGWLPRLPSADVSGLYGRSNPLFKMLPGTGYADAAAYLSYFALAFFVVRWWKMADRNRSQRFSFVPVLAVGFWALVLLLVWQQVGRGALALVMASVIVQLVSPWDAPPAAVPRRVRLRYNPA